MQARLLRLLMYTLGSLLCRPRQHAVSYPCRKFLMLRSRLLINHRNNGMRATHGSAPQRGCGSLSLAADGGFQHACVQRGLHAATSSVGINQVRRALSSDLIKPHRQSHAVRSETPYAPRSVAFGLELPQQPGDRLGYDGVVATRVPARQHHADGRRRRPCRLKKASFVSRR